MLHIDDDQRWIRSVLSKDLIDLQIMSLVFHPCGIPSNHLLLGIDLQKSYVNSIKCQNSYFLKHRVHVFVVNMVQKPNMFFPRVFFEGNSVGIRDINLPLITFSCKYKLKSFQAQNNRAKPRRLFFCLCFFRPLYYNDQQQRGEPRGAQQSDLEYSSFANYYLF